MSRQSDAAADSIIPPGFTDAYGADTVEEALTVAENAPSTTDEDEFKRCPECLSQRIHEKDPAANCSHQRPEPRKCVNCASHFHEPLPPRAAFGVDEPGCPECGSRRLAEADDVATDWSCLDCAWSGDAAVENPRETLIPMSDDRTDAFDWSTDDKLADPDDRGDRPPLAVVDDEERLTEIVLALYDETEASYRDLADLLPYSREWVGRRVRLRDANDTEGAE